MTPPITRRRFLTGAGALAAASVAGPLILSNRLFGASSPSNKINIGIVGFGRQVMDLNLAPFLKSPDSQVVAICDVDSWRLEQGLNAVNGYYANNKDSGKWKGCKTYGDFRELLANRDIDAVFIATPDHWHAPMAIAAFKAGKDVSLEKPITRYINEGRIISDLSTKLKRVFRVDSEFRSIPVMHRAAELVRNGRIGKVHTVKTGAPQEQFPDEPAILAAPPKELNYDMWLGPAPRVEYMQKRVHTPHDLKSRPGWMRNRDYCDGMLVNWGTHLNDIAQWGANTERTGPVEINATGKFHDDPVWNVPESFDVHYRFADGMDMFYKMDKPHVRFEGDKGWIQVDYPATLTASDPAILNEVIGPDEIHFPLKHEKQDFLDAVKSRGQTLEDAEVGHRTTSLCLLANIGIELGESKLKWDPDKERFIDNDPANQLTVRPPMRAPWTLEG